MAEELKMWNLANDEIGEEIQGQFPAEDLKEEVGGVWASHTSLGRSRSILQFIRGKTPTIQFRARFFADNSSISIHKKWLVLKNWCEVDPDLGRPPILQFWVGDAHLTFKQCVLETVGDITYEEPRSDGSLRHVSFQIHLKEFTPYNLESPKDGETRYHVSRQLDYYEMLALREYSDSMLGDVIRKRHPTKPNIRVGDVIKLPSRAALRKEVVEQTSIALGGAYDKRDNPNRTLRLVVFDNRNRTATSHTLLE
jgi:hypothetical protein